MTEEQRFLFDLHGYIVVPGVLDAARVRRMLTTMEEEMAKSPPDDADDWRFYNFLRWNDDYRNLIDESVMLPILMALLGSRFRLDHAYGMASRAAVRTDHPDERLHHQSGMFDSGCYYVSHGERIHNGLTVVSYSLTDIEPGAGGFCCIPGTHKSLAKTPRHLYQRDNNPLVKQIPQKAGDALIFTEALTHGTWPWTNPNGQRRSVLMKYSPGYMRWAQKTIDADIEGLTDRQRLLLQGPSVGQRKGIELDA